MRHLLPALLLLAAPALAADTVEGVRIAPLAADTGVSLGSRHVVGQYGGTTAASLAARYNHEDRLVFGLSMPLATYRLPGDSGRATGLGNLMLEGWYILDDGRDDGRMSGIGVEAHIGLGARSYTWVNDATEVWPGTGVDVVWQARTPGDLGLLYRASVGVHGALDYEPFPSAFLRLGAAVGADYALGDRFGVTAEAAFTYWDTSPFEVAGVFRAEIIDGLRARAGLVLPMAVWVGATPADVKAGIRETTLLLDLQYTL